MKRLVAICLFAVLLWAVAQMSTWGQGKSVNRGPSAETSRRGFQPIEYSGPLTYPEMVRLLLRREGDFRLPVTQAFREMRLVDPRENDLDHPDLWLLDLPGVLKVRLRDGESEVIGKPSHLRLGINETYNLPVIVLNEQSTQINVKAVGRIGAAGVTDRWTLRPGRNYVSVNLRPTEAGQHDVSIRIFSTEEQEGSLPKSRLRIKSSFPTDVVRWGTLKLKTIEGASPVEARVYVTGSDGLAYAPVGAAGDTTLSAITWTAGEYYFYSRGEHEIRLPEGAARVRAVRGFEYLPVEENVEVLSGETASLTLSLERFSDLAAEHWYGGDVHIHGNYTNHEFITPADVRLQVRAEDLNVANLMVANSNDGHLHDEQYFEGRPHRFSDPTHLLYWVEEMRNKSVYGHLCLTGLKSLVRPVYTGFRGTPHPYDYPPNHVQALNATRQGGAASYPHPGYFFSGDPRDMEARELPVDLALGSVQAMDVLSNASEDAAIPYYYRLLNTGLRCAISAGTDSVLNGNFHWIPGGHRVYAYTGERLDYQQWVDHYREGRSFATNGPILKFTVDGALPGSKLNLQAGQTVKIEASAISAVPMGRLEIVANGEVVAAQQAQGNRLKVDLSTEWEVNSPAWVAARVRGPFHRYVVNDAYLFAHTSPIYMAVDGKTVALKEDGAFFVSWVNQLIEMVHERGYFASNSQKQEVIELFERGRAYFETVAATGKEFGDRE